VDCAVLADKGAAVPFDPTSMGFDPGLNEAAGRRFTHRMLQGTRDYARSIDKLLPATSIRRSTTSCWPKCVAYCLKPKALLL